MHMNRRPTCKIGHSRIKAVGKKSWIKTGEVDDKVPSFTVEEGKAYVRCILVVS